MNKGPGEDSVAGMWTRTENLKQNPLYLYILKKYSLFKTLGGCSVQTEARDANENGETFQ